MEYYTETSTMPFGKYYGRAMADVPAPYLMWLYENGCSYRGVWQHIINNLEAIQKEAARAKRKS